MTTAHESIVRMYRPHEGQAKIHAWNAKEKWLEAARRWGKSRGALGEMLRAYQSSLERTTAVINRYQLVPPGFHAWVVVPSYPQGQQAWNEMLSLLPPAMVREVMIADKQIRLNGPTDEVWGLIELKSADNPGSLQTVGLDFLWVSEAQDVPEAAAEKLRPTLRQPGRLGRAIYEGIPSLYPEHWFRRGCAAAERAATKGHAYFHFTVYDNPLLDEEDVAEVETDREILTRSAWERMYLAKFSLSAGFFKGVEGCVSGDLLEDPLVGKNYVAGLDLGVSRDFTVLIIMDSDTRRVVFHRFWDSESWPQVQQHITATCTDWGVQRLIVDATGMGKAMAQDLAAQNLPVEEVAIMRNTREELLAGLQVAIERASLGFPPIPMLLRQLRAFQHIRMASGLIKAQAPPGEHDDEVFALALALTGCSEAAPVGPVRRLSSGRYLPTQAELNGHVLPKSKGQRMMHERRIRRMEERWDKAGVI